MNDNRTRPLVFRATGLISLACVGMLAAAGAVASGPVPAERLARAKYCMTCHGVGGTIIGPGYRQIAARRAGEPDAESFIAARILSGSAGQWGSAAMPPNAVSEDEARLLARWILSMAPSDAAAQDEERRDESAR
ncbi:c-type cytochrome [Thauera sp. WH-2]|uniref:c-type cytochrome n=1 Tax=Thauera sp. WH-2 TaxID=3401574 RepID=UPI003AAE061F